MDSLDRLIEDSEGNRVELYQMLADDNASDLVAMLDAKNTINGYPRRAVQIAYKKYSGYPLDNSEQNYLSRFRKKIQTRLFA